MLFRSQRAAGLGTQLLEAAGLDPEQADLELIATAAGHPYTSHIKNQMELVAELAEQLRRENEVSQALLKNGIEIIATCLKTIASERGPNAYGPRANMCENQASVLSLDLRA